MKKKRENVSLLRFSDEELVQVRKILSEKYGNHIPLAVAIRAFLLQDPNS